jgi:hypothetical protein
VLREVRRDDAVTEPGAAAVQRAPAEQRFEQRRLPRAVRADEGDLLAALEDEVGALEQPLVAGGEGDALGLEHDAAGSPRVQEVETQRPPFPRQRRELAARSRPLAFQASDLRELGLRLLRLRFLVAEAGNEPLQTRDVLGDAVGGLLRRDRSRGLLATPVVPRAGEVVHSARRELEHGRRHRLQEPAVVRDEDNCGVERRQLRLEPLEALDVEVVRGLVEQEKIRVDRERTCE